ncbi:MAG: HEAT repeat domain-containing protein [Myxococcales bacterium]|nr:HEAT repeat domain-containing protein [Myxococcales bacterium]
MKADAADWSWSTEVVYACVCGAYFLAKRWRWIDEKARAREAQKALRRGPVEGQCRDCGRVASARLPWISLHPEQRQARLILATHHRAELTEVMRQHLDWLERRPEWVVGWLLQPTLDFAMTLDEQDDEDTNPGRPAPKARPIVVAAATPTVVAQPAAQPAPVKEPARAPVVVASPVGVKVTGVDVSDEDFAAAVDAIEDDELDAGIETSEPAELEAEDLEAEEFVTEDFVEADEVLAAVAEPPGELLETVVGALALSGGGVRVTAAMNPASGEFWRTADVKMRPVLLRDFGYPLLGVRAVAEGLGRRAVVDAMVDIAEPGVEDLFLQLARQFHVQLALVDERGAAIDERIISSEGLSRNASMCYEGARGVLSKQPALTFEQALRKLAATPIDKRLTPAKYPVEVVDTIELASPARAWEALDFLDDLSKKENLTHLLEVEGLSVSAYENLRRRVLEASLRFGLTPATRFWRRVIGSDLVGNADDWVAKLIAARKNTIDDGFDDLSPLQSGEAWHRIRDLCHRKRVAEPAALAAVLAGAGGRAPMRMRRSTQPPVSASGEIGGDDSQKKPTSRRTTARGEVRRGADLQNPKLRLARATDILSGAMVSPQALGQVFDALDEFDIGELLAILPNLSELGPRVVPGLIDKLAAPRRELRQAASIILGLIGDRRAVEPMIRRLVEERTSVWIDIARALGTFGPRVIGPLCDLLQETPARERDFTVRRVARAMAEVVVSDGDDEGGPGRVAVEALVDVGDPALSGSAREALATLNDVRSAGQMARGEKPLDEDTVVRGFSRLAYEAITVPEMEVDMNDLEDLGG